MGIWHEHVRIGISAGYNIENKTTCTLRVHSVLASSPGRQLKFKRRPGLHCNSVSAHALAITKKSGNRITFLVCTPFRTPSRFQCKLFLVPDRCVCRVSYVNLLSHAPWTKFLPLRLVRVGWLPHATNCAENSRGTHYPTHLENFGGE